jgi:hypothetical protein
METHTRRTRGPWSARIALALIALTCSTVAARAAESTGEAGNNDSTVQHVRTIDSRLRELIATGVRQSPIFRTLVDRLNRSTVIVYVEDRLLSGRLSGRLTLIGGGQDGWRYLRIEIECRQSTVNRIAALGHELQHAVEIADAGAAADETSIRALYGQIGFATDDSRRHFESDAAKDAGNRVRRQLSSHETVVATGR